MGHVLHNSGSRWPRKPAAQSATGGGMFDRCSTMKTSDSNRRDEKSASTIGVLAQHLVAVERTAQR